MTARLLFFLLAMAASTVFAEPVRVEVNSIPRQDPVVISVRNSYFQPERKDKSMWVQMSLFNTDFFYLGKELSVSVIEGRRDLSYKFWCPGETPRGLVFILPGFSGHYTGENSTALAEVLYNKGLAVVAIGNAMNWEFMEAAGSELTPGFTPKDVADVYLAMQKILEDVCAKKPELRTARKTLTGFSLGGVHTLFISDLDQREKKINFDRYVSITPPVDLYYALTVIDMLYSVGGKWTAAEAAKNLQWGAAVYFKCMTGELPQNVPLPLSRDAASFMIGYNFRAKISDIIYSIHRRRDMGILKTQYSWFSRSALYEELSAYGFTKYINTFVAANYKDFMAKNNYTMKDIERLSSPASLPSLSANKKIRVLHNQDDFLLRDRDIEWLRKTFDDRLVLFDRGGHLGNCQTDEFKKYFLMAVTEDTLRPSAPKKN